MSFRAREVLVHNISESRLKTFYIGFDLGVCRTEAFSDILMDAVVDFAFGYHTGILKTYDRRKLIEAAKSIYKIDSFSDVKWTYLDKDSIIDDTDLKAEDKIKKERRVWRTYSPCSLARLFQFCSSGVENIF